MNQTPIKLGPLALLLTVISICLTVLSILTYTTARADMRLAEKFADTVQLRYELEAEGQSFLRDLDEDAAMMLMDAERDAQGTYWTELERNGSQLRIGVKADGKGGYDVVAWKHEREWTQDTTMGNLWAGF